VPTKTLDSIKRPASSQCPISYFQLLIFPSKIKRFFLGFYVLENLLRNLNNLRGQSRAFQGKTEPEQGKVATMAVVTELEILSGK